MMLQADIMPSTPNAVAAVSGEYPASMKKATSCTTTANIPVAVNRNTIDRPQNTGVRSAARGVQPPPPALLLASPRSSGLPAMMRFQGTTRITTGASSRSTPPISR